MIFFKNAISRYITGFEKILSSIVVAKMPRKKKLYCICRREEFGYMIFCDECEDWFHLECVNVTEEQAENMKANNLKYFCPPCLKKQCREEPSSSESGA